MPALRRAALGFSAEPTGGQCVPASKVLGPYAFEVPAQRPQSPLLVEANTPYDVEVPWKGGTATVRFSVDAATAQRLRAENVRVDVQRGVLLTGKGEAPILAAPPGFEGHTFWSPSRSLMTGLDVQAKSEAPVLLEEVRLTASRDAALPFQLEVRALDFGAELFSPHEPVSTFEPLNAVTARTPVAADASLRRSQPLARGITLEWMKGTRPDTAEKSVREVLGTALERLPALRAQREAQVVKLMKVLATLEDAPSREACKDAVGFLTQKLLDIEIVVVPEGKHFTAMPQWDALRDSAGDVPLGIMGLNAGAEVTDAEGNVSFKRLVFIPENDVLIQRHELYHLLENALLPEETVARIDAIFEATTAGAGPFARSYGTTRGEFLTTMGELFEGAHGDEGRAWLEQRQSELSALLRDVTGLRD